MIDYLATGLELLVNNTALKWSNDREMHPEYFWHRPPRDHIVEFLAFHLFVWVCYRVLSYGYYDEVLCEISAKLHGRRHADHDRSTGARPPSLDVNAKVISFKHLNDRTTRVFEAAIGACFLACLFAQIFIKGSRQEPFIQIWWLIMPCHLITLVWGLTFFLHHDRFSAAQKIYFGTLATVYHWGPVSAAAIPDFFDHRYPRFEVPFFIFHHGLLVLTPVYFAARYGRYLPAQSFRFYAHITWIATLINVGPYTIISYCSGLNVNYHLAPPSKLAKSWPFTVSYYRYVVIIGLIGLSILCRNVVGLLGWVSRNAYLGFAAINARFRYKNKP